MIWVNACTRRVYETFDSSVDTSFKKVERHGMILLVDREFVLLVNCPHTTHVGGEVEDDSSSVYSNASYGRVAETPNDEFMGDWLGEERRGRR